MFVETDTPILTKNFAGIGTRDIQNYNIYDKDTKTWKQRPEYVGDDKKNKALQAIKDVFKKTFEKESVINEQNTQSPSTPSSIKDNNFTRTRQSQQAQTSLQQQTSKTLNIYAGTNENADLSNFAERPLNFGNVTAYSLPEGAKSGTFKSKYSIYGIGNVSYSTKENPSYGESFSFDGLSDIFKELRFKTVEGAFQAAKLAFTHPKGNGAKGNKYWQPKQYTQKENSIDGVYYNTAEVLVLTDEGKQLLQKFQNAYGAQARSLGRQIVGLDTAAWNANSSKVMKAMIGRSFEDNPQALERLLSTGNATLTHTQDKGKWGTEFPRLLMEVREELRQSQSTNTPKNDQLSVKDDFKKKGEELMKQCGLK